MKSSSSNSILRQDCICLSLCQPPLLLSSYYFYITYADLLISYLVSAPVDPFIAFSIHSPFHPSQVIRRRHTNPGTPSIPVKWSRSCNYMHFSSNSLSLSLCPVFLSLRHASPLSRGKGALESLKQRGSPLSFPRFRPRPRPNRVYLPNFPPFHPSFPTHETSRDSTLKVDTPRLLGWNQREGSRQGSIALIFLGFGPLKKLRHFISPRPFPPSVKYPLPLPRKDRRARITKSVSTIRAQPSSSFDTSATGAEVK